MSDLHTINSMDVYDMFRKLPYGTKIQYEDTIYIKLKHNDFNYNYVEDMLVNTSTGEVLHFTHIIRVETLADCITLGVTDANR